MLFPNPNKFTNQTNYFLSGTELFGSARMYSTGHFAMKTDITHKNTTIIP